MPCHFVQKLTQRIRAVSTKVPKLVATGVKLQRVDRKIGVVGLGYVGLPVALAFGKAGALAVGYDIDVGRVEELHRYFDRTLEASETDLRAARMNISAN